MTAPPPRRRWQVTVRIGADSIPELEQALDEAAQAIIDRPRSGEIALVGSASGYGYIVEGTEQPEVTNDAYHRALEAYQASRREVGDPP